MAKQLHQRKRSKQSLSNEWWTPDQLFIFLCSITKRKPRLDVCATNRNSKCDWYIDRFADATNPNTSWVIPKNKRVVVWCNPPNEFTQELLFRAYQEWCESNCKQVIMMIVPANTLSSQGIKYNVRLPIDYGENVFYREIDGRPEFLLNGKKPKHAARNAYIFICWGMKDPNRWGI